MTAQMLESECNRAGAMCHEYSELALKIHLGVESRREKRYGFSF